MLHAAFVMEWVNFIQYSLSDRGTRLEDGTITFPLINANRVLQPHKDALILTLRISGFELRRVLIDLSSSADLLQMSPYRQMGFLPSALENPK